MVCCFLIVAALGALPNRRALIHYHHLGDLPIKASPRPPSATPIRNKTPTKRAKPAAQEDQNEEEDDEVDEPVRKRLRRSEKSLPAKAPNKPSDSTKQREVGIAEELDSRPKRIAGVKAEKQSKAERGKKGSKASAKAVEPDDEESQPKKPVESSTKSEKSMQTVLEEEETAESDGENEEASSEDEEKPEVAAKAREKVQTTLKSQSKDPYPDWKPGEPVPYAALCTTFSLIEMTTKRLIISAHCSLFLRQVLRLTPQDLLPTVQLMINKLAADYAGIELGIGESLIMKAIGESTGRSLAVIKADQNEIGDLGLVAAKSRSNQPTMFKPKALTVKGVLDGLMAIATVQGDGSQGRKIAGIKKLLSAADADLTGKGSKGVDITKDKGGASEAKFIVRTLEGKLRLGLAEKTVLVALAHAMVVHETEKKGNKVPSSEQLAKGETILKTVYR